MTYDLSTTQIDARELMQHFYTHTRMFLGFVLPFSFSSRRFSSGIRRARLSLLISILSILARRVCHKHIKGLAVLRGHLGRARVQIKTHRVRRHHAISQACKVENSVVDNPH